MKNVINHSSVDVKLIIYHLQGHLMCGHHFIDFFISGRGAVDGSPLIFLFMAFKPFKDMCTK
jgi:hypothetical protein